MKLTKRQTGTVLAALRSWQRYPHRYEEMQIATDDGDFNALDNIDIDRLCERINAGGPRAEIVVYVEGGNVLGVRATETIDVKIIDFDNLEAEGKTRKQRIAKLRRATRNMISVY